ncbi:MAG: hypothetical protein HC906_11495 [Bacteroidales bacterium]|nr:hypothetical protein [Bacteroidales bacterium]
MNKSSQNSKFQIGYYLSKDTVLNIPDTANPQPIDDVLLSENTINYLPVNSEYELSSSVWLSDSMDAGNYFLIGKIEPIGGEEKADTSDNIAILPVTVGSISNDLEIENMLISSDSLKPEQYITIDLDFISNGNKYITYSRIGFYLSTDSTLSSNDFYFNSRYINNIFPGEKRSMIFNDYLPHDISLGSFYLICKIDPDNNFYESNENNNIKYKKIVISNVAPDKLHDLSITRLMIGNSNITLGNNFRIEGSLEMSGLEYNDNVILGLYLSKDTVLDVGDLKHNIYSERINSNSFSCYLSLPSNTALGSYYIIGKVDDYNTISETNEKNNTSFIPVTLSDQVVLPSEIDLEITDFSIDDPVFVQGNSPYIRHLVNSNCSNSLIYSTEYYLVNKLNEEILLKQIQTYHYGSGYWSYIYLPIADTIQDGLYWLKIVVDTDDEIDETDEENNSILCPVAIIKPDVDFDIENFSVQKGSNLYAGSSIYLNFYVYNNGLTISPQNEIGYFLSADTVLNVEEDTLLFISTLYSLANEDFYSYSRNINIPNNIEPGNYQLFVFADYLNRIEEENEVNNIEFIDLTLEPDQVDIGIENAYFYGNIIKNQSTELNYRIRNFGNKSSGSFQTAIYLSKDTIVDETDLKLSVKTNYSVYAFDYNSYYQYFSIPNEADTGRYILITKADNLNQLTENDENNNLFFIEINIENPKIDLSVTDLSINNSLAENMYNSFSYTLRNFGSTSSGNFQVRYYLSKDTLFNPIEDSFLGSYNYYSLYGYGSDYENSQIKVPSFIGSYYFMVVVDLFNDIIETNESNNIMMKLVTIEESMYDLLFSYASLNKSTFKPGDYLNVNMRIKNQGNTTSGYEYVTSYLSTDSIKSSNDVYMDQTYVYYLNPSQESNVSNSSYVPTSFKNGKYYVINVINSSDDNTANNISIVPFTISEQEDTTTIPVENYTDLVLLDTDCNKDSIQPGGRVRLTYRIKNEGNLGSSYGWVYHFLSTDDKIDDDDLYLSKVSYSALDINSEFNESYLIDIPFTVDSGTYFLISVLDYENQSQEENKQNNTVMLPLKIFKSVNSIDENKTNDLMVYPCPASTEIHILNNENYSEISFIQISGQLIRNMNIEPGLNIIDVSDFAEGSYTLILRNNKLMKTLLFVKLN